MRLSISNDYGGEIDKGQCPAYHVVEEWMTHWNYDAKRLVDGTAYRLPDENE